MSDYKPKVGDRVTWREGSAWSRYDAFGTISRVGEASCTVRPLKGGKPMIFRASPYGNAWRFRPVSDLEIAVAAWEARRPSLSVVRTRDYSDHIDITFRIALDGSGASAAVADLERFTRWLSERPKAGQP